MENNIKAINVIGNQHGRENEDEKDVFDSTPFLNGAFLSLELSHLKSSSKQNRYPVFYQLHENPTLTLARVYRSPRRRKNSSMSGATCPSV